MLVLSRKANETIFIGLDIRVTVIEVRGDKVRLGFDAPRNIAIHREEIFDAINRDGDKRKPEPAKVVTIQDKLKAQARQPDPDEGRLGDVSQDATGEGIVKSGT